MGGQKGIALFYKFLAPEINLTCVSTKNNDPAKAPEYEVLNILSDSRLRYINPLYFFKLKRIIRQRNITILILEHPYFGWLGVLLKWFCKVKLVVHSHNIEGLRFKSTGQWWWGILWNYEKRIHRSANLNFFIHDEDRDYAIRNFRLPPQRCATITYGFDMANAPLPQAILSAKNEIRSQYHIGDHEKILLFNGTLNYKPNRDALDVILEKINPLLLAKANFGYRILICGNKLPVTYNSLEAYRKMNIIYAGFVDDITVIFKSADIFINPVTDGGGIKTKVVEALGYGLSVISTRSGAIGIPASLTGKNMTIIEDNDWEGFAEMILRADTSAAIPAEFFGHFYWGNIAAKAAALLNSL